MTEGPSEAERVGLLREVLTATGAGIYLATHVAGPVPAEVATAVRESDDLELRLGRAGPEREEDLTQRDREARAVLAAVLGASPDRVVLTHGLAEAVRLVVLELLGGARERRRVMALGGTDALVLEALRGVCAACGAVLEVGALALDPGPSDAAPGEAFPRDVALVVASHVTDDGRVQDVARLGRAAREGGARLLVDAGLSVGALPVEVPLLGAHAVVGVAHRWLLGPEDVSFAWLAPDLGPEVPARLRGAAGAFARGALLGLARSVGWLLMYADLPWVLERTGRLAARLHAALSAIPGVDVATPAGEHAGLLAWSIDGWSAEQAVEELSHSVFAILEADHERERLCAGVGAWNREGELDRLAARVAELAAHPPASLPRRPSLTILGAHTEDAG